ncbi:SAG1252 family conjugative relaxosome accessory protein [Streptococcus orisratti]|nr:SAG1252 family conjugative relaxosome accessory protein [Streptococcus orisratti]
MKQEIKLIRKQFRITKSEEEAIKAAMKEQGVSNFSDFLRKRLLQGDDNNSLVEKILLANQYQKLEQISRDIHEILLISKSSNRVTEDHVGILLGCIQDLIGEVGQAILLSPEFLEKYRG